MVNKAAGTPGISGYRGQPGQKGEPLVPSASCAPGKAISRDTESVYYFRASVDVCVCVCVCVCVHVCVCACIECT